MFNTSLSVTFDSDATAEPPATLSHNRCQPGGTTLEGCAAESAIVQRFGVI